MVVILENNPAAKSIKLLIAKTENWGVTVI